VLVGNFSSVVFVLPGSMGDGWEDLVVHSRIASLVRRWAGCFEIHRRSPLKPAQPLRLCHWRLPRIALALLPLLPPGVRLTSCHPPAGLLPWPHPKGCHPQLKS
jgi:hypothetical protein